MLNIYQENDFSERHRMKAVKECGLPGQKNRHQDGGRR